MNVRPSFPKQTRYADWTLVVCALLIAGCASTGPHFGPGVAGDPVPALPDGVVAHEVFLLGNTGDFETDAVLDAVADAARAAGEASTVVLLGDQTAGAIPDSSSEQFDSANATLIALGNALRDVPGRIVAVPGDRDWARGEEGLRSQEKLLEALLGRDVLTPGDQSGGPREIELAEGLRLVALDTAWWLLDPGDRPSGEAEDQDVRAPADVVKILQQILIDRDDSQIVVVGHHPLRSSGEHAGHRTFAEAAPTLGLAPMAAQTVGLRRQDLASPAYHRMRDALDHALSVSKRLVYASAHDHSLQVLPVMRSPEDTQTFLVSGSGGGAVRAVASGRHADYSAALAGYQRLVYYENGRLWLEVVIVDPQSGSRSVALRQELAGVNAGLVDDEVPDSISASDLPSEIGGTVVQSAQDDFVGNRFANTPVRRLLWGSGYRDVWQTPVEFEVLDMGTVGGGLTPIKKGGGMQTTSLRLQGADGLRYELRLLEKSGLAQVPRDLRAGVIGDVVLDLRSAMNPYGPQVTFPLAQAAGVYQAKQHVLFVPDDPRLGRYRGTFGNRLALFGIRADDDVRNVPGLIGGYDLISGSKLREELREDQDHRVDQQAYIRARLLDMVLADWDRHADQWRWAAFEPGELDSTLTGDAATKGKVYLPVARDRDFAFHNISGLISGAIGRFFDLRLQPFRHEIRRVRNLTTNGFPQDRRFLNELTREDFRAAARDIQMRLTDETIRDAVAQLPLPIYDQIGDDYISKLHGRRDDLRRSVDELYELHANIVDIVGSDERERFVVERGATGSLVVTVCSYKGSEDGRLLYRRTFRAEETKEVRIYAFGGRDRFDIIGGEMGPIRVRVIGGSGKDTLAAEFPVLVYDTPDGMSASGRAAMRLSDSPEVNSYDPHENVLPLRVIFPQPGYNSSDGVILGAQLQWSTPGFRMHPYAATHTFAAGYATATGGVFGSYDAAIREAVGGYDMAAHVSGSTPRYARNYYGIGNASVNTDNETARLDLARAQVEIGFGREVGPGLRFEIGPTVRIANPEAPSTTFGNATDLTFNPSDAAQLHAGLFGRLDASTLPGGVLPRQGVRVSLGAAFIGGVAGDDASSYGQLGAGAVAYAPVSVLPESRLALSGGISHRLGAYPFFDAAVVGGDGTIRSFAVDGGGPLRGFQRERFAGRTAASASAELGTKLLGLSTFVAPVELGAFTFVDAGRVWADDFTECGIVNCVSVDPDVGAAVHVGVGGGLWLNVVDMALLRATVATSDESTLFSFGLSISY